MSSKVSATEIIQSRKNNKRLKQEKLLEKLEKKRKLEEETPLDSSTTAHEEDSLGRDYTISVAVAGSILDNAQSPELRTYLGGQIARGLAVFKVDEVIVFEDRPKTENQSAEGDKLRASPLQLARILQFLECPQYLRKHFFPLHKDLQYSGVLNPSDMPHHFRSNEFDCIYREGIILDRPVKEGAGSLAFIGFKEDCIVDKKVPPGIRVTVQLEGKRSINGLWKGKAVSPHIPRTKSGLYWGYNVRVVNSLFSVFQNCPYKEGYDVRIGTSERGTSVDNYNLPKKFKHLLIVIGGLKGLEFAFESESDKAEATEVEDLFDCYLNTCPNQGSRTIRTEEALLITLSALRPKILESWSPKDM
ncbi:putative methyltransferase C9orf114 [Lepeophtheirus salmonis]|uniref:putative methyltransferase C9orf114 n=1 Tax=Lepeophtheirus salmonis TaxID=72036 RepID=UPI001AE157B4|nr:putative methyltransferase C9orf114 [Lepeophtheirus salmonis]